MSEIDEQIKGWLKEKFLASLDYHPETQGGPEYIEVVTVDTGWECGCYSEFTRDDSFVLTARLKASNGREFGWRYGYWGDLPSFIRELDDYINGFDCPYDEEDY